MVKRIIVKTPGFIGDTIMMTPALELLKEEFTGVKFTIVCKRSCVDVFDGREDIEKIIIDDIKEGNFVIRTIRLIRKIRMNKYEMGFIFHNTLLDALIFKLSRISKLIGYNKEGRGFLLDYSEKLNRSRHYVNSYCHLVNAFLGNKYKKHSELKLFPKETKLFNCLDDFSFSVGFVLGGENKGNRAYPVEKGLELMKILGKHKGINIILLGDINDSVVNDRYEDVLSKTSSSCLNLSGKTTVKGLISCINKLDLLVCIDTSVMHIAAAVKTQFIVLQGSSTSPFDCVRPKVDFGVYLNKSGNYIEDSDLIRQINPFDIVCEIERIMKIADNKCGSILKKVV